MATSDSRKTTPKSIQLIAHPKLTTKYRREQSNSQESLLPEDKMASTLDLDLHLSEADEERTELNQEFHQYMILNKNIANQS